jgi:hypothetical protein
MISASDSFISYLNSELAGSPPVNWVHKSAGDTTSHLMQMNKLNVSVIQYTEQGSEERLLTSLDLIGDDERTVMGWAKTVRDILIEEQFARESDFEANPASPMPVGRSVFWDGRDVNFVMVRSDGHSVHLNATFNVRHVR